MIKRTNKITLIEMVMGVILFFGLICSANAADESKGDRGEPKKIMLEKTVSGEVSGISSNFLAIVYGQDAKASYEMALAIDKNTKVERKKSLKEIAPGDTVSVKYEETTQASKEKTEKGKEKEVVKVLGRLAKVVTFIRAAEDLQSSEEPASMVSKESQDETAGDADQPQEGEPQK